MLDFKNMQFFCTEGIQSGQISIDMPRIFDRRWRDSKTLQNHKNGVPKL